MAGANLQTLESTISFSVKTVTGKVYPVGGMKKSTKIEELKQFLTGLSSLEAPQQRLVYDGKSLTDETTIGEAGIRPGTMVHMILMLRGG